jgi:hypothetical protein
VTGREMPSESEGLWVRSDVRVDGTYGVTVTVGADHAFSLDRAKAIAYANACVAAAMQSEHQHAVLRLLMERLKLGLHAAGTVIVKDLRIDRSDDNAVTHPMRFEPTIGRPDGVPKSANKFLPLVRVCVDGHEVGCLEPDDIRDHGEGVLNALAGAELDERLFRYLTTTVDIEPGRARAVIASLNDYLPADDGRQREER